jgi:hypothetical protein
MMSSQTGDVPSASKVGYNIDEGMVGIDSASRINEGESGLLIKMMLILCSSNIFFH